jgi:hypothetical protein
MDKDDILRQFSAVFTNSEFSEISARTSGVDFSFHTLGDAYQQLAVLLDSLNIAHQTFGLIMSAESVSRDTLIRLYTNNQSLFYAVYQQPAIAETSSLIVLQPAEGYIFDHATQTDAVLNPQAGKIASWMNNYRLYAALLKLFKGSDILVEFDDAVKNRLMIVDNGKEKNNATVTYQNFDPRLLTKQVQLDLAEIDGRINDSARPNNSEWLAIFRHNIVNLISAQEEDGKTFTEIFLNIAFIIQNTSRDYEIYLSGFSFDKISKELKEDRQKYFNDLYQAQDKIKSQVIAVPLAVGTSIYAFFQLNITFGTFIFLLVAIAIYIAFIWWYLILYERDLTKLRSDIKTDSDKFKANYPKVFELFKSDFDYITGKVKAVTLLSYVIRGVTLADWVMLVAYVFFFYKEHPAGTPPLTPKFLSVAIF